MVNKCRLEEYDRWSVEFQTVHSTLFSHIFIQSMNMWIELIIIIIVNLYWGCQHHRKSGLQKGPLKVTTNQYNYVKM